PGDKKVTAELELVDDLQLFLDTFFRGYIIRAIPPQKPLVCEACQQLEVSIPARSIMFLIPRHAEFIFKIAIVNKGVGIAQYLRVQAVFAYQYLHWYHYLCGRTIVFRG